MPCFWKREVETHSFPSWSTVHISFWGKRYKAADLHTYSDVVSGAKEPTIFFHFPFLLALLCMNWDYSAGRADH